MKTSVISLLLAVIINASLLLAIKRRDMTAPQSKGNNMLTEEKVPVADFIWDGMTIEVADFINPSHSGMKQVFRDLSKQEKMALIALLNSISVKPIDEPSPLKMSIYYSVSCYAKQDVKRKHSITNIEILNRSLIRCGGKYYELSQIDYSLISQNLSSNQL